MKTAQQSSLPASQPAAHRKARPSVQPAARPAASSAAQQAAHHVLKLPARPVAQQNEVHFDTCNATSGEHFSTAHTNSSTLPQSASKKLGPLGSRKESTVPSEKPVSKEIQAGQQSNLEPTLSRPASARKDRQCTKTFSEKNASSSKNK